MLLVPKSPPIRTSSGNCCCATLPPIKEIEMLQLSETVLAPDLDGGQWMQHGPVSLTTLRDKAVVLVDFWDYTCVNCIRTLPFVVAWNKRYKNSGLVVVGVHAPEF